MRHRLIHGSMMMTLAAGIFLAALPSAARQVGSDRAALVKKLEYDVTIEDPTLFTGPWKPISGQYRPGDGIGSKTMSLREADVHDLPDYACLERDREHQVNNDRF